MKTWQKVAIVFVGGGVVWSLSFVASIKPEMAMMLSSVNAAVVAAVSMATGFKAAA